MSAWTWTYVKVETLPKEEVEKMCDEFIEGLENIWYYKDGIVDFNKAFKRWVEIHKNPIFEKTNKKDLKNQLKEKIKLVSDFINGLKLVKEGKLALKDCLKQYKNQLTTIQTVFRNDDVWIHVGEIFRLREYSEMTIEDGIKTVDGLIEYLKKPSRHGSILWFDENNIEHVGMCDKLEQKIRKYYERYGDGNFSVSFG